MKKKLLIIFSVVIMIFSISACGNGKEKQPSEPQKATAEITTTSEATTANVTEASTTATETNTEVNTSDFISAVQKAIKGQIGENEKIKDVTYTDNNLCIFINLGESNPAPLTMNDLAFSRNSSITDAILQLAQYDDFWDTITVDFGSLGKITNKKEDVQKNEYGMRYFSSDKFILE